MTVQGTGSAAGVRVVWWDLYRTGVARVRVDGVEFDLPFEFRDDFDLTTEEATPEAGGKAKKR